MLGTLLNVAAILLGAALALLTKWEISARRQQLLKVILGVATTFFGLKLLWNGLATSTIKFFFFQFIVVVVAMVLGHLIGKLFRIQAAMNRLGQTAKQRLERAASQGRKAAGDGFLAATVLFCAAPLGIVGAIEDGLSRNIAPLAIKGVMDGLAAFSFARMFGWTVALTAVPLAALLSAITLLAARLEPWLEHHDVLGVVHACAGLLMTYIALVIFEVKKVELGDYLPSLVVAPLLMKAALMLFG
jgi:uncharacterized protein